MTTTATMTASEAWLAQLAPAGLAYFMSQTPETQLGTLDMIDGCADRLARLFTGDADKSGHMPAWLMPTDEWEALGSPRTAEAWMAVLS